MKPNMSIKELEQLAKNIPDDLFEIPKYGKLIHTILIDKYKDGTYFVAIKITTGSVPIATFKLFEEMRFFYILHIDNSTRLIKYLKIQIPNILDRVSAYLTMIGFKELGRS